jgi:glycine cleavage system T protein (aminomethyltransferase)
MLRLGFMEVGMGDGELRKQYEKASRLGKLAFAERPYFGSPGAPAQAESNASQIWGHINAGYLIGYEYTRWWKESRALREAAVLGDWSWLNKTRVTGRDAFRLLQYASVKDLSRQRAGQIVYTPMASADGKVAVEGLTLKFGDDEYLFTQSAGLKWLEYLRDKARLDVRLEDVTPDYSCFALQGPRSTEVLEALTRESWRDLGFSRFRRLRFAGEDTLVARQGVTGEIGYEFLMPTARGRAHELWRGLREAGRELGLRELGFKAQMVGHTETGIATVLRDFLPARGTPDQIRRLLRHWMSAEELAAADWDPAAHFCSPAELSWGHTISLERDDFHGRQALVREAAEGGPRHRLVGLEWSSEDMAALYAALFRDGPSAPPPDLPYGQFRVQFLKVSRDGRPAGWASGHAYSPTLRRMISLARVERATPAGAQLEVHWGGFSDEPVQRIRARAVELPFIARNREKPLA